MTGRIRTRVRIQKNTRTEIIEERKTRSEKEREVVDQELDDFLDEVDGLLEENAQQFVDSFVQKGGE
jgi:ubiquitin-like protein Pup